MSVIKTFITVLLLSFVVCFPMKTALTSTPKEPGFKYSGDGSLEFFNTHTNERVKIIYKTDDKYIEAGLGEVNYILRCRLTNKIIPMNQKLIELIDHIQDHFGADEIEIISGHRSPELNGALRSAGRGVAKRSYHLRGMAIDLRIPGVSTKELRDYAVSLRAGGVGYYPGPDFVHIDVGPIRTW